MVKLATIVLIAASGLQIVSASVLQRRIAQQIDLATVDWKDNCIKAAPPDNNTECFDLAVAASQTLLAAGGNCDQQIAGDHLIDYGKFLGDNVITQNMTRLAKIFIQTPRNSPTGDSVPYCHQQPKNSELRGFFHCQFAGCDLTKFTGDQSANTPLGISELKPLGSCPAHPSGPIPNDEQLVDIVTSPGVPEGEKST